MAAAQAGDAEAYGALLRELVPVLRAFVTRILQTSDAAAGAEDVVQQVLLQIHRARHSYRPERPFGPWLRAVARNAARDALRARGRRAAREVSADPAHLEAVAAAPAAERTEAALDPALADALTALPPGQREALELLYLEDLSIAEAALRVGTTSGALKLRAHRALRTLRARLGREPE
jgi:RNA polymerase sigma factor (sigma-70 family)